MTDLYTLIEDGTLLQKFSVVVTDFNRYCFSKNFEF